MGSAMYVFSYSHKNGVEGNFHMHSSYGLSQLGNKVWRVRGGRTKGGFGFWRSAGLVCRMGVH